MVLFQIEPGLDLSCRLSPQGMTYVLGTWVLAPPPKPSILCPYK